jgi:hypothetical protein
MDGIMGSPPQTTVNYPDPIYPANYNFASAFFNQIMPQLMGGALPTYPGNIDPGLSQTMQTAIRMAQGYAQSPAPYALGQAGGTLGGFMNPQMANVGWGTQQPRPSYMTMPGSPGGSQYPGSYSPWDNSQQGYGYGGGGQSTLGGYNRMPQR